ncbi:MAG: hypothetical protein ABI591_08940 [Kofleriaceae bacterium]
MKRFCVVCVVLAGCSGKKNPDHGLAPADDWGASQSGDPAANQLPPPMTAPMAKQTDDDDLPDVVDENGNNPHAGLKRNAQAEPGGIDVSKMGGLAPDPNRAIDPTHRVTGTITISPKIADRAKSGTPLFVIVKQADKSGQPTGTPLAVDKLAWDGRPLTFDVTEGQAMVNGTQMTGDVVIMARYDQDGDAISKQPNDIVGQVRVRVPAQNANITLDTVLP